ncbi:MAG: hypothetical protein E7632_05210 [Ruminococcaceae bacterium]|nr:hypothetical protein [Oscillospiraceae bacterium]
MEKTVSVVDEFGNRYDATYVKRAKGLVKHGRARFIDEETICLVRPPEITEDNKMADKETAVSGRYNLEYALEQIEKIAGNAQHIYESLKTLETVKPSNSPDCAGEETAKAVADVIRCRETTNQRLIEFYSKMVEDLKPRSEMDKQAQFLAWVKECTTGQKFDDPVRDLTEYGELWKQMNEK